MAVVTAQDLAEVNAFPDYIGYIGPVGQRPLASDRVRFVGAPYAVVVALDRYIAEDAAALVAAGTEFESLPTVADLDQALAPGAPKLYDHWDDNCSVDQAVHRPEVDRAFDEADHTFTDTYISQRQSGLPMETRGVVADAARRNAHGLVLHAEPSHRADHDRSSTGRGFGVPESTFVMERIIDRVARLTGTDRVELRRRMLLRRGQLPYVMHGGGRVRLRLAHRVL
ncbi:molybdopterin cofactor-binding domain-containing protein [Candidatus Poriferisodalis sp.]|uniref:molybdopterin cofactor-binding domain-containing protein n=1 Tax=Candidatus Poriferisodalis sp. TaxID=3101277 RepID=UPI003C6EE0A4